MQVLLVYDITDNRIRGKVADICLDYGLERIQYSAFQGDLARVYQEEIMHKLEKKLGKAPGKIQLFPLCARDWGARINIIREAPDPDAKPPSQQKR
ncbi:MAG: CRISPR-associated endonuclease Cas2 [Anaerolineae bacterium]|nr:CRISPR-associated endonuclease Cas2 [Anaerolineae bacterium]